MGYDEFHKALIKMHEEDDNKHALQWFLNDIFELAEKHLVCKNKIIKELENFKENKLWDSHKQACELIKKLKSK